ncbi:MAG: SCO family protein [Nitrospirae bacterium]|nr:SCO family protein [Nitrospirota bacterium]
MMRRAIPFLLILFFLFINKTPAFSSQQDKIKERELLIAANETVGRRLGDYSLIDQDGKRFNLRDYLGKPFIINFIYTNCASTCSISTVILSGIVEDMNRKIGQKANIITVSFDYEADTSQRMKEYGENFTKDFTYWRFAAGDRDTIVRLTDEIGFSYEKTDNGYDHVNMISVIDSNGKIYEHIFYGADHNNDKIKSELIASLNGALSSTKNAGDALSFTGVMMNRLKLICSDYDPATGAYRFNYLYLINYILLTIACFIAPIVIMWWREISSLIKRLKIYNAQS